MLKILLALIGEFFQLFLEYKNSVTDGDNSIHYRENGLSCISRNREWNLIVFNIMNVLIGIATAFNMGVKPADIHMGNPCRTNRDSLTKTERGNEQIFD